MTKSPADSPDTIGTNLINTLIRTYEDVPDRRLDAFAIWQLQANEHLCTLYKLIENRRWSFEEAHVQAVSSSALKFSVDSSFLTTTRALVGWCDRFGPKIDLGDMPLFNSQLLAWSRRSGAYGPPMPLANLESTLAAVARAIDRIDVFTGFATRRPNISKGPYGLWATEDFGTIGRVGYKKEVDLSSCPTLRSAFGICFRAYGNKVNAADFNNQYTGERSAKYKAFQDLNKRLAILGVSVDRCRLVDKPKRKKRTS